MMKQLTVLSLVLNLISPIAFAADQDAPEVFAEVVPVHDGKTVRHHMDENLEGLFNDLHSLKSKLETEKTLGPSDFAKMYEILTEMRAHFVAVLPKVPAKLSELKLDTRAEKFRFYQKYLALAIIATIEIEEAIDQTAATDEQIAKRNQAIQSLVAKFTSLVGDAHRIFRN